MLKLRTNPTINGKEVKKLNHKIGEFELWGTYEDSFKGDEAYIIYFLDSEGVVIHSITVHAAMGQGSGYISEVEVKKCWGE